MSPDPNRRAPKKLSTARVVFLVVAAAAPMAAMVGNIPLALVRGNGIGLPVVFVVAALVLLCFSIGYAAMSKRVVNSGAFYTYIARALGKPLGGAGAALAAVGYTALAVGLAAAFGYYSNLVLGALGLPVPWYVLSAVGVLIVALLGYRSADLSARVLGVLMVAEFGVLIILQVLVVGKIGPAAFPPAAFSPTEVLSGSVGVAAMFAFVSFVGFESAALYGEETRNPLRSIPRAIYTAVLVIGVFYVITAWVIIGAAGGAAAPALAAKESGNLIFTLAQRYGGDILYSATAVLLCTSLLASLLALHNAASRYLFAMGREGILPAPLGNYHSRHLSPHIASITVTGITVVVVGVMAALGADPYGVIAASMISLGTLGIILVQAITALAVVVFFWRRADRSIWRSVVAPAIGVLGLGSAFVLASVNYSTLTGSSNALVNLVPLLLVVAAIAGILAVLRLRRRRPQAYAGFADSQLRARVAPADPIRVDYARRYCLVGGGPAGMVMARRLLDEGVPFDWFERHSDFGGIWDRDNPGTPMYESAHFISSKYTSGFYGYPMPESFPDYPSWRQIRDYIRGFGREFGLYDAVTFSTAVDHATLNADTTWTVRLSTGETREYAGLIAAPGVTWSPNVPDLPGAGQFTGDLRHSVSFDDGLEFRGKRVLVVGGGNSAVDIASDAARHADQAYLSVRRGYRFIPKHVGGLPTDAVLAGILEPPRGLALPSDPSQLIDAIVGDLTRYGLPAPDHAALASHPIMNSQVLHHLSHGDLIAKPDVDHLTTTGAVFVDGSEVEVDTVLLATGYDYRVPFIEPDLLTWNQGHPQLYLNVFSREVDSLYILGFIEFADAAYKRFDEMAQLVVIDIRARETRVHRDELVALKATDHPDLRGGIAYIDSPRHANYVESHAYQQYLAGLRDRFDWPDLVD